LKNMLTRNRDELLNRAGELVARHMGLHFPRERYEELERGLLAAASELGFQDIESCLESLVSRSLPRRQVEILASHLTVGETYFFRDEGSFKVIEERILAELITARRGKEQRLRIWSAACCTGEEPYSIAISLHKMIPDLQDWNVTILATDINPVFLKKALDGIYGQWSFRDTPGAIKERYFTRKKDGRYEVLPQIKKLVTFAYLNLVEDIYPSLINNTNAMDVIFCRNVLMYFTPQRACSVINNIRHSLVDGGWLLVSATETSPVYYHLYTAVSYPGVTLYRKDGKRPASTEIPPYVQMNRDWSSTMPAAGAADQPVAEADLTYILQREDEPAPPLTLEGDRPAALPITASDEALALFQRGQYADAIDRLLDLLPVNRASSADLSLLARAHANLGQLCDALEWCKKAIAADRLNAGLYYLQATIQQEQGEMEAASASLKQALYLDQDFVPAHFALGNLSMRRGKSKESIKHFENAAFLLKKYKQEEVLPDSEGMTAGRLSEIINCTVSVEKGV